MGAFNILLLSFCLSVHHLSEAERIGFVLPANMMVAETDTTAEKILLAQRTSGGWPKQIYEKPFDYSYAWKDEFIKAVKSGVNYTDATIDNHATSREIRHLVKAYAETKNQKYLAAAEAGIRYLLKMQYANGGFPQFYPDTSGYRKHITYNDDAMLNALRVLQDVTNNAPGFEVIEASLKKQSGAAVKKGIECILKTQIRIDGKLTVWCAQHDHISYLPAKARAYELPSFSGSESVGIVRFLMEIPNPSQEVKTAIQAGVKWLSAAEIKGFSTRRIKDPNQSSGRDVIVVADPKGKLWARFYDLETGKPFFCGRDGIKKANLSEIENERRVGYAYYGIWPEKLLSSEFPNWLLKHK